MKSIFELTNWLFVACDEITKRHFNARVYATRWKHMKTQYATWTSELRSLKNSKWVWSRNTTNTNCRQPRGTARKSCSTVTRHQEDKLSKATSSLFPIKSFACLHGYMASTWQFANKKTSNHIRNAVKYYVKTVYLNAKIHNDRE